MCYAHRICTLSDHCLFRIPIFFSLSLSLSVWSMNIQKQLYSMRCKNCAWDSNGDYIDVDRTGNENLQYDAFGKKDVEQWFQQLTEHQKTREWRRRRCWIRQPVLRKRSEKQAHRKLNNKKTTVRRYDFCTFSLTMVAQVWAEKNVVQASCAHIEI